MRTQSPVLGQGQYHLAVASGCAAFRPALMTPSPHGYAPTRYREVVLTLSKLNV